MFFLLGEAPTIRTVENPSSWLVPTPDGRRTGTANRLRDIAGWDNETYMRVFSMRSNALKSPRVRTTAETRESASMRGKTAIEFALAHGLLGVVALGRLSADAIGAPRDPFAWVWHPDEKQMRVCYVPHTSGRSRFWNDPTNVIDGRRFLETLRRVSEMAVKS